MELNLNKSLYENIDIKKSPLDTGITYAFILENMFCLGIGSKSFMHREVDKIFDKNKIGFMEAYKRSDLYKSSLIETAPVNTALYTEKVAGILQDAVESENYTQVLELYKKAYKKIYTNIKNLKTVNHKNYGKYISQGVEGNYEYISTIFICMVLNKYELREDDVQYLKLYFVIWLY